MATAAFQVIDRNGIALAELVPAGWKLTTRLSSWTTLEVSAHADAIGANAIQHGRGLRMWREPRAGGPRVVCFNGLFAPLTDEDGGDAPAITTAVAHSPFAGLVDRHRTAAVRYDQVDAGAIALALLAAENDREQTHLAAGTVDPSKLRDREYERGKQIAEAIVQLSQVIDGFCFVERFVDAGSVFAHLDIRWPDSGADARDSVRFEFGGNLTLRSVRAETQPPVNRVVCFGAGEGDAQLVAVAEDAASITQYGLREATRSYTDVSEPPTLQQHADEELRPEPVVVYTVEPTEYDATHPDDPSRAVPRLFDDFNVGDIVSLRSESELPRLNFHVAARVLEATLEGTDDGGERLSALTFEVVE